VLLKLFQITNLSFVSLRPFFLPEEKLKSDQFPTIKFIIILALNCLEFMSIISNILTS